MPQPITEVALSRIQDAVRQLKDAAKAESTALEAAMLRPEAATLAVLHAVHRRELDAVQSLVTAAEILERVLQSVDAGPSVPRAERPAGAS